MKQFDRRQILAGLGAGALAMPAFANPLFATRGSDGMYRFGEQQKHFALEELMPGQELRISHFEVAEFNEESILLRCVAKDGTAGVAVASPNKWWEVKPLLERLVLPYLQGEDALELEEHWWRFLRREYEYSGAPLWNAWGHAENAVLDLIGQATGKPVAELLGGIHRTNIPFYISANRRGGDPMREVAALEQALEETGCTGVKVKIGRRMGRNRDASEGWTNGIVSGVRERLGEEVSLYVDANGAYDAPTAIALQPMLDEHGVAMMEEPCPYQDLVMTAQVTAGYRKARSGVMIATGENEGSPTLWRQLINGEVMDVGQPDPQYGGGLLHCVMIARALDAAALQFNPHWPRQTAEQAPLMHLCAAAPSLWGLQEYRLRPRQAAYEYEADYTLKDGHMTLPDKPGFGVSYPDSNWHKAQRLEAPS
jgi:L-alanine-DL-glutamate epimerase-like enolase superfamily enzyme